MKLEELIKLEKSIIEEAKQEYIEATRKYNKIVHSFNHENILLDFKTRINHQREADHDYSIEGELEFYTQAWFSEGGVGMRIPADHPNDIIDSHWTFEEVEEILNYTKA